MGELESAGEEMEPRANDDVEPGALAAPAPDDELDAHGFVDDEITDVRAAFHIDEGVEPEAAFDEPPPSDEVTEMRTFDIEATAITEDATELRAAVEAEAAAPRSDEPELEASTAADEATPSNEATEVQAIAEAPSTTEPEPRAASRQTIPCPPPEGQAPSAENWQARDEGVSAASSGEATDHQARADAAASPEAAGETSPPAPGSSAETRTNESTDASEQDARDDAGDDNT
jgi:hypothetical protein